MEAVDFCKKHKRYKAIKKPRVKCDECWRLYRNKHELPESNVSRRKKLIEKEDR